MFNQEPPDPSTFNVIKTQTQYGLLEGSKTNQSDRDQGQGALGPQPPQSTVEGTPPLL